MLRTSISLDEQLVKVIEAKYGPKNCLNFSYIVRDLLRKALGTECDAEIKGEENGKNG